MFLSNIFCNFVIAIAMIIDNKIQLRFHFPLTVFVYKDIMLRSLHTLEKIVQHFWKRDPSLPDLQRVL